MNADQLVVFDTSNRNVIANLDGFKRVHGVAVAPGIHRVYASVTGKHQVAAVDTESLKTVGTAGPINYPDGLAYAPKQYKVFVSDEHGGVEAVIDAANNKLKVLSTYQVGEDPDVLAYDPGLKRLYVSAESGTVTIFQNQGESLTRLGSFEMPHAHTVSVDPKTHLVYFPLENIDGHPILRIMRPPTQKGTMRAKPVKVVRKQR
jgi:DNA-binding beta-propeller fold protein YncE